MKKVRKCKTNDKVYKNKQSFNKGCYIKRKKLRLITKALNLNPSESRLTKRFCNLKKHYRSLCRKVKRKHEQELLCKLEQLHYADTESFWKLLRQVKGDSGLAFQNQHGLPPLKKSLNCFNALIQKQTPEFSVKENPNIKNVLDIENLNKQFDVKEVTFGLRKLGSKI